MPPTATNPVHEIGWEQLVEGALVDLVSSSAEEAKWSQSEEALRVTHYEPLGGYLLSSRSDQDFNLFPWYKARVVRL